jgi:hypothetical protein
MRVAAPNGLLNAILANSPSDIWSAGSYTAFSGLRSLIEHWNGTRWARVSSPKRKGGGELYALAPDGKGLWAVGDDGANTLVERWNGKAWSIVPSPSPNGGCGTDSLAAVSSLSASDAWAVGLIDQTNCDLGVLPLALHWNGSRWKRVKLPNLGNGASLNAVAAITPSDVWVAGDRLDSNEVTRALIAHWNGVRWSRVSTPVVAGNSSIYGLAAVSDGTLWAVGTYSTATGSNGLIEQWANGKWSVVSTPEPGGPAQEQLTGIASASPGDAWAVGTQSLSSTNQAVIEHWNGTAWTVVNQAGAAPANAQLAGVSVLPGCGAWTAGQYAGKQGVPRPLIERNTTC